MATKDYYSILGVPRTASADEIKKAYRKLAHVYHPDKKGGNEEKFKEINEAYGVLGNIEKRSQYDQFGQTFQGTGPSQGGFGGFDFSHFGSQGFSFGGENIEDIFSGLFGGGARTKRGKKQRGDDIEVTISVSFLEMVKGIKKPIEYRRLAHCPDCAGSGGAPGAKEESCPLCHGRGVINKNVSTILGTFSQSMSCDRCDGRGKYFSKQCHRCKGEGTAVEQRSIEISVPAGIEDGQVLSLEGAGNEGARGTASGNLYVVVRVQANSAFIRQGNDIYSELRLVFDQLAIGDEVAVQTVDGEVMMKVPAGTQPGELFRIRNKGIPRLSRSGRGDHLVRVSLSVPTKLSSEERHLLEEWRALRHRKSK